MKLVLEKNLTAIFQISKKSLIFATEQKPIPNFFSSHKSILISCKIIVVYRWTENKEKNNELNLAPNPEVLSKSNYTLLFFFSVPFLLSKYFFKTTQILS